MLVGLETVRGSVCRFTSLESELREFKPQFIKTEDIVEALRSKVSIRLDGARVELYSDLRPSSRGPIDQIQCDLVIQKTSHCVIV